MYCGKCGNQIKDGNKFCEKCGTPVPSKNVYIKEQDKSDSDHQPKSYEIKKDPWKTTKQESGHDVHENKNLSKRDPATMNIEPSMQITNKVEKKKKKWIPIVAVAAGVIVACIIAAILLFCGEKNNNSTTSTFYYQNGQQVDDVDSEMMQQKEDYNYNTTQQATEAEQKTTEQITTERQVEAPYNQQKVTVTRGSDGYMLSLETWSETGDWEQVYSCKAAISEYGLTTNKREGDSQTPSGTFDVLFCIGINRPETELEYINISSGDVWVDDSGSRYYNTLQKANFGGKDWNSAEDIYSYFQSGKYNAAIFFNYNGDGRNSGTATAGNGSVIFLFGRNDSSGGNSNSGDIYVSASDMTRLLSYLDSSKHPIITIG